jgi:hypothetical protein
MIRTNLATALPLPYRLCGRTSRVPQFPLALTRWPGLPPERLAGKGWDGPRVLLLLG